MQRLPVVLDGVGKTFYADDQEVHALAGLDLSIAAGEFMTLLGPSGSGKTTALQIISGLEQPSHGVVTIGGEEVTRVPPNKRDLGVVFQSYALFPHLTVGENIAFPLRLRRRPKAEIAAAVEDALRQVRLTGFEDRRPTQLSGGQQQRVAIARALVFRPRVLLMDEPLGALDKQLRDHMQLELRELQQRVGITCIFVTHDQEEAMLMSDRIAVLHQGRLQQVGSADDIYRRPTNSFVASFIGRINLWDGTVVESSGRGAAVRLSDGSLVWSAQDAAAGKDVTVAVRPEALKPADPESATGSRENVLPLEVRSVGFVGASALVQGAVGHGLEVLVQADANDLKTAGSKAWLSVDPDDILLLDRDPG